MMKLRKVNLGLAVMIGALVAANDGTAQTREPLVKARVDISLTDPDTRAASVQLESLSAIQLNG